MIYVNKMQTPAQAPITAPLTAQMNFLFRARMLARDLATWLRAYQVSLFGGVGNSETISQRLYRLPAEYGNILRVFFGDQPTEQVMNFFTQYIANLQSLFRAQMSNDIDVINNYTQQVYQVTNDAAAYLASINPYWTQGEWNTLLNAFTNLQIEQGITFLTKEYERNIDIFDRILSLTNIIGDYFSEGLTNYYQLLQQPVNTPP